MAIDLDQFWAYQTLGPYLNDSADPATKAHEVGDIPRLNEALSALPFDHEKADLQHVLEEAGYPNTVLENFPDDDFDSWKMHEFARIKLRRLLREELHVGFGFDAESNARDFLAQMINDHGDINQIHPNLLARVQDIIDNPGEQKNPYLFSAILEAYLWDDVYAFTPEQKKAFLQAVVDNREDLEAAGVARASIAEVLSSQIQCIGSQAEFQSVARIYTDPNYVRFKPDFLAALRPSLLTLISAGVTGDDLRLSLYDSEVALQADLQAQLQTAYVDNTLTAELFQAVYNAFYQDAGPLQFQFSETVAYFRDQVDQVDVDEPNEAFQALQKLHTLFQAVPDEKKEKITTEIRKKIPLLIAKAQDHDQLIEIVNFFVANGYEPSAKQALQGADNLKALLDIVSLEQISGLVAGVGSPENLFDSLIPGGVEALGNLNLAEYQALKARVETPRAASQKDRIDEAIKAQAQRLAASVRDHAELEAVAALLRGCDAEVDLREALGNPAVLKHLLESDVAVAQIIEVHGGIDEARLIDDQIMPLLEAGISLTTLVERSDRDGAAVLQPVIEKVTNGVISTPKDLLAIQNALIAAGAGFGEQLEAFRAALVDKVDALFGAISAESMADITQLVHGSEVAEFKKRFLEKVQADAQTLIDNDALTIDQIQALVTNEADYNADANIAFRTTKIEPVIAEINSYLSGLSFDAAKNKWKHTPAGAAEAEVDVDAVKAHLQGLRNKLQRFNKGSQPAAYMATLTADQPGLQALKASIESQPSVSATLLRIYGNKNTVNREFALTSLRAATDYRAYLADILKRINAANNVGELTSAIQAIEDRRSGLFYTDSDRRKLRTEVVAHLHKSDVLIALLEKGITPEQIVDSSKTLGTSAITEISIGSSLQAPIRAVVYGAQASGLTDDQVRVILQTAQAHNLQADDLAQLLKTNFVALVAKGLITEAVYADVTRFVSARAGGDFKVSLVDELAARREQLFAEAAGEPQAFAALSKAFHALAQAHEKLGQSAEFRLVLFADAENAEEPGNVLTLLLQGFSIDTLLHVADAPTQAQVEAKVRHHITEELNRIAANQPAGDAEAVASAKTQNRQAFAKLATLFVKLRQQDVKDAVANAVKENALSLLTAGVSVSDLQLMNPGLTVEALTQLTNNSALNANEKAALNRQLSQSRAQETDVLAFVRHLPIEFRNALDQLVRDHHVTTVDVNNALEKAFNTIARQYPNEVSEQGVDAGENRVVSICQDFYQLVAEEIQGLDQVNRRALSDRGYDLNRLGETDQFDNRIKRLAAEVEKLQQQYQGSKGLGELEAAFAALQKRVNQAAGTDSLASFKALEKIHNNLQEISEDRINQIETILDQERATMARLQQSVREQIQTLDTLMSLQPIADFYGKMKSFVYNKTRGLANLDEVDQAIQQHLGSMSKGLATIDTGFYRFFAQANIPPAIQRSILNEWIRAKGRAVDATAQALIQKNLGRSWGRTWHRDRIQKQAEILLNNRTRLAQLDALITARIQDDSHVLNTLKEEIHQFKAAVEAKFNEKGDADQYKDKIETDLRVEEIDEHNLVDGQAMPGTFSELLNQEDQDPALLETAAAPKTVLDKNNIHGKTLATKVKGIGGEQAVCAFKVLQGANHQGVGIQVKGTFKVSDDGQDTTHIAAGWFGSTDLSDGERVMALQSGVALAKAKMELGSSNLNFFGGNRSIDICGNFSVRPNMSNTEKKQLYFNIISVGVAIKALQAKGYTINTASTGYQNYASALAKYSNKLGFNETDHPEFSERFEALTADSLQAKLTGKVPASKTHTEEATQSELNELRSSLGMSASAA